MNPNQLLLAAIKERQQKNGYQPFQKGIITADRYMQNLLDCHGSDLCYRFAATKANSFHDLMTKAARTLTFNDPDAHEREDLEYKGNPIHDINGNVIEFPPNTLMAFKNVLTTPKKDRDGDRLRSEGAEPDDGMLLLYNHTHTLPIGKSLGVAEQNKNRLALYTAVVDINELSHDVAVMLHNDMGRFSHGFKALDFTEIKYTDDYGRVVKPGGFDIKSFEVMEESWVSVAANTDSGVEEVILSLVSSRKLTSPLMKSYGLKIKEKRPVSVAMGGHNVPVNLDLSVTINGKSLSEIEAGSEEDSQEVETEINEEKKVDTKTKCGGGCACNTCSGKQPASGEEDDHEHEEDDTHHKEMKCEHCGGKMVGGKCSKCGWSADKKDVDPEILKSLSLENMSFEELLDTWFSLNYNNAKAVEAIEEKAAKVLKNRDVKYLTQVKNHLDEIHENEALMSAGSKAMCREAKSLVDTVIKSSQKTTDDVLQDSKVNVTTKDAMTIFLSTANSEQRAKMFDSLKLLRDLDIKKNRTVDYKKVIK